MSVVIELQQVSKRYRPGEPLAVQDLSFEVREGEVLSILGPSGCGKTTTLRLIAGLERPDAGRIFLGGRLAADPSRAIPPEQRGVGMVFQDYALFPHLTAVQNIAFGVRDGDRAKTREKVTEVLRLMGLEAYGGRYPHELSGGQQQRVALARALAPNPIVILLDEPFSNLDPDMRGRMRQEVQSILRQTGMTAIVVTHDHEEAFAMADQVAVLNSGRLEQLDTPEMVYHIPTTPFVADFVGQADFVPGSVERDRVLTEIGVFPNVAGLPTGERVVVMIRPDDVNLIPMQGGGATIVSRQFRGSEILYSVRLPSGRILHSSQISTVIYPDGMEVDVKVIATHVVLFPERGEEAHGIEPSF